MSNNKASLTIAITVYKRPGPLLTLLDSIIAQNDDTFDILVSDDHSEDNLADLIIPYKKKLKRLTYHYNKKNLGFAENVAQTYTMAKTRYVWFMCDDDVLLPGAIKAVQNSLQEHEPVVAMFNHMHESPYGIEFSAGVTQDTIYNSLSELKDYQPFMRTMFLSTLVVEKRLPIDPITSHPEYKDNVYTQLTLAMLLLDDKFKLAEFKYPVLKRNVGYKYGDFFKFILIDQLKAVDLLPSKFDTTKVVAWFKRDIFTSVQLYFSQKLGVYAYTKPPTYHTIKLLWKYYGIYCFVFIAMIFVYHLVPAFVFKWYYKKQLIALHGEQKAIQIYNRNINRAYKDSRSAGFTAYR